MTSLAINEPVRVLLLDIEGTTTSINFVFETLFPYARNHIREFLMAHQKEENVAIELRLLRQENESDRASGLNPPVLNPPVMEETQNPVESTVAYIHWLMDRDRKSTPLKTLQGKIWEEGYRKGKLTSDVYPDVPPSFRRWTEQGRRICIYSSGSVLAQQLLFAHTAAGDLSGMISGYFDTRTGAKQETESYRRIAETLGVDPLEILFLSDVTAELAAARSAGLQTLLMLRPENKAQPQAELFAQSSSFDPLFP